VLLTQVSTCSSAGLGLQPTSQEIDRLRLAPRPWCLEKALVETLQKELESVQLSIQNSNEKLLMHAVRPAPMTSLRDVEAGVPFLPDIGDSRLLIFVQKTRE
jgi:hypothetical protein